MSQKWHVCWILSSLLAAGGSKKMRQRGKEEAHHIVSEAGGEEDTDENEQSDEDFVDAVGAAGAGVALEPVLGAGDVVEPKGVFDPEDAQDDHDAAGD